MTTARPRVFKTCKKKRDGKGFSRKELKEAGTNTGEALKLRIPLDPRRKTAHQENIESIKTVMAQKSAEQKPKKKKPKKPVRKNLKSKPQANEKQ